MNNQLITDRMIYIVIDGHLGGSYLPERNVSGLDRKTTVKDIAECQWDDVLQVLECNPVEGICRDVTEDILAEAEALRDRGEGPLRHHATQEQIWDRARDYRKTEAA